MNPDSPSIMSFPHNRRFGVELEFFNVSEYDLRDCLVDNGIEIRDYDNVNERGWLIGDDGSINGSRSVELVSPILSGVAGLQEVLKVVNVVKSLGAKVNRSCGLHVHVDAGDLSGAQMLNAYKRYALHEDQIDSFMPASRRESVNEYCASTRLATGRLANQSPEISAYNAASLMERTERIQGRYVGGRYTKLNLCAYLRHGTIEFRHHGGTVESEKVLNWIMFCVNFVEVSRNSDSKEIFAEIHHPSIPEFYALRTATLNPTTTETE